VVHGGLTNAPLVRDTKSAEAKNHVSIGSGDRQSPMADPTVRLALILTVLGPACSTAAGPEVDTPAPDAAPGGRAAPDAGAAAPQAQARDAGPAPAPAPDAAAKEAGTPEALPALPRGAPGPVPPAPWKAMDIGDVVIARGASMSGPNAFYYKFGGREIGGAADSFYFAYQAVKGDFEFWVKLGSVTADPMAQVGVMARVSLDPGSPHAALVALGDEQAGGQLLTRKTPGGMTMVQGRPKVKPTNWLRVARAGNTLKLSRAEGGAPGNWTDEVSTTLDMPADVFVGLAMAARAGNEAGGVELDDCALNNLAASPATMGWFHDDVGAVGGTALFGDGKFAVSGWGEPPTPKIIRFTVAYKKPSGSQRITARFLGQTSTAASARAGVMVRDVGIGLGAGSQSSLRSPSEPGAWVHVGGDNAVYFQNRAGDSITTVGMARDLAPPFWIRVEKQDTAPDTAKVTGFTSKDGQQWTMLGTANVKFSYTVAFLAGLFSSSGDYAAMDTASFDNVAVAPLP
jgi:hypothetical protein